MREAALHQKSTGVFFPCRMDNWKKNANDNETEKKMRDSLDFSTRIQHHSDTEAYMDVSITNYSDGAQMSVSVDGQRITLNRADLHQLVNTLNRYEQAQEILKVEGWDK